MVRRIEEEAAVFPASDACGYWHLHLPIARGLVDSQSIPYGVRRLCAMTLIQRASHLARCAPVSEGTRVVAAITLPELWDSQIIVFFGEDYFAGFFDRKDDAQIWEPINEQLSKRWDIEMPQGFTERTFVVVNKEGEGVQRSQIWFVGELNAH